MVSRWSHLPDLCLEAIFKFIPLVDLFCSDLGLVCKSWYRSRLSALSKRRRLVIVQNEEILEKLNYNRTYCSYGTDLIAHVRHEDGSPWLTLEPLDKIKLNALLEPNPKLTSPFISSLMTFSKITHLTLVFNEFPISALPRVILLFEQFSEHLIELKFDMNFFLDCNFSNTVDEYKDIASDREDSPTDTEDEDFPTDDEVSHMFANLFTCLNRLETLRHLKLFIGFRLNQCPQHLNLSHLTTLTIGHFGKFDWFLSSLHQDALNIYSIEWHKMNRLKEILQVDHQLGVKFNVLFLENVRIDDYDEMRQFCTRFSSLTRLDINHCSMPMTMLARCLSQLSQLVEIKLNLFIIPEAEEEQPQQQIAQVCSVRLLTLFIVTDSHHDSARLFIPEIFPNLQVLCLEHWDSCYSCIDCKILHKNGKGSIEIARQISECKRITRQPFRRCANLHTVSLYDTLIHIDEL